MGVCHKRHIMRLVLYFAGFGFSWHVRFLSCAHLSKAGGKGLEEMEMQGDWLNSDVLPAHSPSGFHGCCWVLEFMTMFRLEEDLIIPTHRIHLSSSFTETRFQKPWKICSKNFLNLTSYLTVKIVALNSGSYKDIVGITSVTGVISEDEGWILLGGRPRQGFSV